MNNAAYIISFKYAPGLNKEFVSLGRNFVKQGLSVKYLLATPYKNLEWQEDATEYITDSSSLMGIILDTLTIGNYKKIKDVFSVYPPMFLCFYNSHPLNIFIAKIVKKRFPEAKLSIYLHDAYKSDKKFYGMIGRFFFSIAELINNLTMKYVDCVISPSEHSSQLFKKRYPSLKEKNHIVPLLIPDQRVPENKKRVFFSLVGNINKATGHEKARELLRYITKNKLDYELAIITSSRLPQYFKKLSDDEKKAIKIVNKKIITDSEINEVVRKSYAVLRLDKEINQSGVIPVAYMNETPVIVCNIAGLTQHVCHKYNGYVVSHDCSLKELIQAMEYINGNFQNLSANARRSYEQTWAEWNFDKYYGWLIKSLQK
jgi:hypothetical protein